MSQHPYVPLIVNGMPPAEYYGMPPEFMPMEYMQHQQNPFMMPYCGPHPQHVYPMPGMEQIPPPNSNYNYMPIPLQAQNSLYNSTPPLPTPTAFTNIPLPPGTPVGPQPIPSLVNPSPVLVNQQIPTLNNQQAMFPQPIPSLVPPAAVPYQYPEDDGPPGVYYQPAEVAENSYLAMEVDSDRINVPTTPVDESQDSTKFDAEAVGTALAELPSRWRSMEDSQGRVYYYHTKLRIPQWEPPLISSLEKEGESSDEGQESCEEDSQNGEEGIDDFETVRGKLVEGVDGIYQVIKEDLPNLNGVLKTGIASSPYKSKKKRPGLVTEWVISPRTEEDRMANQMEVRRYKENKEKLRRRKEHAYLAANPNAVINKYKKKTKDKHKKNKSSSHREEKGANTAKAEEAARRIKEHFRASTAKVMVHHLNPFRKDDCPLGRITNTADFKHLARKLTHFVMLKELKHCRTVDELECNDSVKQKAREFVKKYMSKFGPVYQRPADEMD